MFSFDIIFFRVNAFSYHQSILYTETQIDQMSLHAPSQAQTSKQKGESHGGTLSDTSSEMKRQIHFLEEKEDIMVSRLSDFQKERVRNT